MNAYWLLHIRAGQPILWGPYDSDDARLNEFDMCLIDPGTEYIVFLDPGNANTKGKPHAWRPSKEYERERLDRLDNLPE